MLGDVRIINLIISINPVKEYANICEHDDRIFNRNHVISFIVEPTYHNTFVT